MEPSPQESAPSGRKGAMEELVGGQIGLEKVKDIITAAVRNIPEGEVPRDLAEIVLSYINNGLAALSPGEFEEVSQVARPMKRGRPNASDNSEGSVTRGDRRGCYKRRSKGETWMEITPSMTADDYQWRKYGQKSILNAAYPRHYFRCTHKLDQACQATKQVQQISDDPKEFRTIYQGSHTCADNPQLKPTEVVSDNYMSNNPGNSGSSVLISFERNKTIDAPLKNEVTISEGFLGNEGTVVPSASSNIFDSMGDTPFISPDPWDAISSGHDDNFVEMVMGWEDTTDFGVDYVPKPY